MVTSIQSIFSSRRFWTVFALSTLLLTPTIAISTYAGGYRPGSTVQVDNTAPFLSIASPSSGDKNLKETESVSISFNVEEYDSGSGINTVSLTIDGTDQGLSFSDYYSYDQYTREVGGQTQTTNSYSYSYSFSNWSDGTTYTIKASATDNAGNSVSDSVDITTNIDVTLTKNWIHPTSGDWVSGTIDLVVTAYPTSDVSGSVSFTVDGGTTGLVSTSTSSPVDWNGDGNTREWVVQLDTTQLTDGSHTVEASLTDTDGDAYTLGIVLGSETNGGIIDWLAGIPITIWLVSAGFAILLSFGIAYAATRYGIGKETKPSLLKKGS